MLRDRAERYGVISRVLHWSMALLFAWQFFGMASKIVLGKVPLVSFMVGTHGPVGFLLMVLIVLRLVWAFSQRSSRPTHAPGIGGLLARGGHYMLYILMLAVPALALLRQYGSGRGFSPWGLTIMEKTGQRVEWMMEPGNLAHGVLGWLLLALAVGHVAMALVHQYWIRDGLLQRMLGR